MTAPVIRGGRLRAAARDVRFVTGQLDTTNAAGLLTAAGMDAESVRAHALKAMSGE